MFFHQYTDRSIFTEIINSSIDALKSKCKLRGFCRRAVERLRQQGINGNQKDVCQKLFAQDNEDFRNYVQSQVAKQPHNIEVIAILLQAALLADDFSFVKDLITTNKAYFKQKASRYYEILPSSVGAVIAKLIDEPRVTERLITKDTANPVIALFRRRSAQEASNRSVYEKIIGGNEQTDHILEPSSWTVKKGDTPPVATAQTNAPSIKRNIEIVIHDDSQQASVQDSKPVRNPALMCQQ